MKAYKLFFEPDRVAPQFKRLRFEEVDVPLRDVLTSGCHPVGACHYRGSPKRDTSHAAEAVVNKLNEDDARVAALKDFGYSHDLHTASGPSWSMQHPAEAPGARNPNHQPSSSGVPSHEALCRAASPGPSFCRADSWYGWRGS